MPPVNGQLLLLGQQFSLVATSAPAESSGLLGVPKSPPRVTDGWNLYTKLPLALTGLELDSRLTDVLKLLLPSKPERLLGLVA